MKQCLRSNKHFQRKMANMWCHVIIAELMVKRGWLKGSERLASLR